VAPQPEIMSAASASQIIDMDGLGFEGECILSEAVPSSMENTHLDPADFDPTLLASLSDSWLGFGTRDNSNDTATALLNQSETDRNNPPPPPIDFIWDRIYQEPIELLQGLTVHRTILSPKTVLIEMSRVLEANKAALQCVSTFLKKDSARHMPHLTMLYANVIARVLMWYQDAAGFGDLFKSRNRDSSNAEPMTTGDITPPSDTTRGPTASYKTTCFEIQAQSFTVGSFNVDEPCMQLAFRNQLLCHEVRKAGPVIDELAALAVDQRVAKSDRAMYSALGLWLKGEHEKTLTVFKDAIRHMNEKMGI
jgi:hypothetical protein